ncbi:MAG: CHAT domain-containing protein [Nitrospinaceae bacterium]
MDPQKLSRISIAIFFLILSFSPPAVLGAEALFNKPVQITTHPGEDFAADISPDGKLMVYVSGQSGHLDLWLKHLGPGVPPPDEPLTVHSAQDNSPKFSPDGRRIAFVSHRSDPKGDLYVLDLDERGGGTPPKLLRLTPAATADLDPAWSPDGNFIYFTSTHPETGKQGIFRIELKTLVRSNVEEAGVNPAVSPDGRYLAYVSGDGKRNLWVLELTTGQRVRLTSGNDIDVSPAWRRDGGLIYFTRYRDDTNFDGQVTIDDNPNIWSIEFTPMKGGLLRQLTDSSTYDLLPAPGPAGEGLLFTSHRKNGIDIWKIPPEGLMPGASGYGATLQVAGDLCSGQTPSYPCLLVYTNVIQQFAGERSLGRIRYRLARDYQKLGHLESAARRFGDILKKHSDSPEYQGLAKIDLLLLQLDRSRQEGQTLYREKLQKGLVHLKQIAGEAKDQPHIAARALLEKGHLLLKLDRPSQALDFYKKVTRQYPSQRFLAAEAAFSQSGIYSLVGDQKRLVEAFVQVVRDYYDVETWSQKAIQEILNLHEKQPTLELKVSSLQTLTVQYKDLPRLAAAVQNRIGELYHRANENLLAKEAYKKTITRFSSAASEAFKAQVALANIYSEEENFGQSLAIYRKISRQDVSLEDHLRKAREGWIRKSLEKGTWELRVGEVKLAVKTFLKVIDFDPGTVKAHRGYLDASARLKKVEKAIGFYKNRLKVREDSAVDRYALGLAYTYLDPPGLDAAEREISKAIAINAQQVFFHQTLGWVFEQKERSVPGQGFLERALNEYRMALALNDETTDAENENNLLLNLGNGHYLLKNHFSAYHYYRQRGASGFPFYDPNREAIFRQRFGESAFKSGFPAVAAAQFKKALKIVSKKNDPGRMAELNDRIALVYQDTGDAARAVEYFSKALELNRKAGNQVSLSRTLRNIANNLFTLNRQKKEPDPKSLNQALSIYFQAIDNLEKFGVVQRAAGKKNDALIGIEIETGIDADASGAARGFDKTGEQKLIFHYIGKIYGDFGDYDKAVEYFQKKLALIPENLDVEKNIPVLLEKALIENQIGNYLYHGGHYDSSIGYFKDSYQLSRRLNNKRGIVVNAANIAKAVFTQCQNRPLFTLRDPIENTIHLLEEASAGLGPIEEFTSPEYIVLIKNYLGIFNHYLGFRLTDRARPGSQSVPSRTLIRETAGKLKAAVQRVNQSIRYFEEGLSLLRQSGLPRDKMEPALKQNLELTYYLAGRKGEARENPSPPERPAMRWKRKYIDSLMAPPEKRLPLLLEAEGLLSRLPFGAVGKDSSTLALLEDLYLAITRVLFDKKQFARALHFSEKGHQQLLLSLRPSFYPVNEDRRSFVDELSGYAKRLEDLASSRKSAPDQESGEEEILEEYQEVLELLREEDPVLASLFAPEVPGLKEIQGLLRPGELLLKVQKVFDGILVWRVDAASIQGIRVPLGAGGGHRITRLVGEGAKAQPSDLEDLSRLLVKPVKESLEKASSLLIIADGDLEFLPWAALRPADRSLAEMMPITFLSSLHQLQQAESKKNLYNSRFLGVEVSKFGTISRKFASAVNLTGEEANRGRFQSQWKYYGVIHVASETRLGRLDPASSYIRLGRGSNRFERIPLADLFADPVESNFIALTDVTYEFHPEIGLSPTAPLIQGLVAKGYPGILLRTGAFDPEIHAELTELFYRDFREGNPAEALRRAQIEIAKRHPGSLAWTGYRVYGFPGMGKEEKTRFAHAHFKENAQIGAKAFLEEKDWIRAIDYLEKALVLIDFLPGQNFADRIYKTLGQAAYNMGDYPKAIHYQTALLKWAGKQEDPEELADALYFLGILYSRAENYSVSVETLRKALSIFEENGILDRLAESYSTLGIVEENALDYGQALKAFRASLKINDEIGEDLNKGRELRRIGRIYYLRLNQYSEARKYFQQAYDLFEAQGYPEQIVETLLELGLVSEKEGDFTQALNYYGKAQSLATDGDFRQGLSKALLYQANSHWYQGNYQKAFRFQKESLKIAQAAGDKRQQAFIYNTLGLIYWTLNDSPRALTHLNHSLELAKEVQSPLDIATAYNNIGLVHRKDKRYEKSIEFFKKALEKDIELKSKWGQGYTHRNMGMSYLRMGKTDEAETHIKQAVDLSREIGNKTNLVKSMLELGHVNLERKNCKEAIGIFRGTAQMAAALNIQEVHWRALRGEGVCLAASRNRAEAVKVYKQAVKIVDRMRAAIKVEEFQNGFLTDKQDVYKELILLLLDMGRVEESFNFAERAKSRSFIDLLGNQRISLKNEVSQKLYDALTGQKKKIRKIEEGVGEARSRDDEEAAKRLRKQLVEARNRYQDLLIEAKEQSPEISAFVTVDSITLQELDDLLELPVALIEYLVTDKELVTWVVVKGRIDVVRTPVTEADLNALIKDYRKRMQQLAPVEDQSARLHGLLIQPIRKLISGKRVLGIVPNGFLHYISFASLKDAGGYLVERHPLFYSPSASVLKFTFKRKFAKGPSVKVLALGNPDLGDLNYDLPLAEMEAKSIQWDFPKIDVLTREKATESWLNKHIGEYGIIHIASHGEFDPVNPLFSSLKLSKDENADGNFEVNEVFSLQINADIVTLSACQTGLGDITGGDELVGLNRAFIYAGTHAILSSLWRVSDISTAILIKHFYRNYVRDNKAESLRKAQLLVKKLYPHPSYWAGFNLTGDYR